MSTGPPNRETDPWSRQPREPGIAFAAFVVYRNHAPPRSLYALAEELDLPMETLEKWSTRWNWIPRANAYATYIDARWIDVPEEVNAQRDKLVLKLHEIGCDLLEAAHCRLTGASDDEGNPIVRGLHPEDLSASDVARFLDLGTRLARIGTTLGGNLGEPSTVSEKDLQRILSAFIALAARRMPSEEHEAFVRDSAVMVRALGSG